MIQYQNKTLFNLLALPLQGNQYSHHLYMKYPSQQVEPCDTDSYYMGNYWQTLHHMTLINAIHRCLA